MTHLIETHADAERTIEHFNGFHDGFIKRVELISHDRFEENGPAVTDWSHLCTGEFDVVLDIAHYNYGQGEQPSNRLVSCRFEDVQDFCLDLRGSDLHDWPIYGVDIGPVTRPIPGPLRKSEGVLAFRLTRSFLVEGTRWERREQTLFSFRRAHVEEGLSI